MSIRGGKIISTAVTIVGILLSLVLVIIGLKMGVFTSPETLQIFLRGAGLWAPLIFVGIQVVQVVFPIIPGGLTPMKFRRFVTIILLGKPLSLLAYSWGLATALSWLAQFLGR